MHRQVVPPPPLRHVRSVVACDFHLVYDVSLACSARGRAVRSAVAVEVIAAATSSSVAITPIRCSLWIRDTRQSAFVASDGMRGSSARAGRACAQSLGLPPTCCAPRAASAFASGTHLSVPTPTTVTTAVAAAVCLWCETRVSGRGVGKSERQPPAQGCGRTGAASGGGAPAGRSYWVTFVPGFQ